MKTCFKHISNVFFILAIIILVTHNVFPHHHHITHEGHQHEFTHSCPHEDYNHKNPDSHILLFLKHHESAHCHHCFECTVVIDYISDNSKISVEKYAENYSDEYPGLLSIKYAFIRNKYNKHYSFLHFSNHNSRGPPA